MTGKSSITPSNCLVTGGGNRSILFVVALIVTTILAYGNGISNGFVWDDHDIIVNNPANRDLGNVFSLFSSADSTVSGNQKAYYRPLNRLTYLIDYKLFGMNPAGYHVENILIHLLTVLLLFFAGRALFAGTVPAFVAALLFAVHPLNAEAVNFLSARNSLLSGFFVLITVLVYLHAEETKGKHWYYLSGLFFFLGLLCKEQTFMLPLVLLLYGMTATRPVPSRIREKFFSLLPFLLSAAVYLALRAYALASVIGVNRPLDGLGERLLQNIYIIPRYAAIILFPLRLNALYSVPKLSLSDALWLVPLWIFILAVFLLMNKKSPATRFGLIWIAVNFIPISNIIPIPSAPMAERYLYLPAMGLWLIVADQASGIYGRIRFKKTLIAAGVSLAVSLAVLTIIRNGDWKDDIRFYTRMAETNPHSALAHFSLGLACRQRNDILAARKEWETTASLDPAYFHVLGYLGESYLQTDSLEQAGYYYSREVEVDPDDAGALFNLGMISEKLGNPRAALNYYERILSLRLDGDPNLVEKVNARVSVLRKSTGVK